MPDPVQPDRISLVGSQFHLPLTGYIGRHSRGVGWRRYSPLLYLLLVFRYGRRDRILLSSVRLSGVQYSGLRGVCGG